MFLSRLRRYVVPLLAAATFALSYVIFWYHGGRTVGFHDSGEFSLVAACTGLTHPPGAPTWSLVASAFYHMFAFQDPARGANLFAGFMGSITLALLVILTARIVQHLMPELRQRYVVVATIVAPLVVLHSPAYLEQCFFAEQYTLMMVLMLSFLLVLDVIYRQQESTGGKARSLNVALGLIAGLAYGNHPSQLCLALPAGMLLVASYRSRGPGYAIRQAAWMFVGLAPGLLVFLWVPICGHLNRLMDPVRAITWERFWWSMTRQMYPKRPWSEVPHSFVKEIFLTYDFIGELGIIGFILAVTSVLVLLRRANFLLLALLCTVALYAAGMFQGFVFQKGIDVVYLRQYGVRDWHIPLYVSAGVLAAIGAGALMQGIARRRGEAAWVPFTGYALLVLLVGTTWLSVRANSVRNFSGPSDYIHDCMSVLPKDAIMVATSDNASMMLSYYTCRTGKQVEPQRVLWSYHAKPPKDFQWNPQERAQYIRRLEDPAKQALSLPRLSEERVTSAPLYLDFVRRGTNFAPYLLVRGPYYQLMDVPTTTSEILESERQWRAEHPEGMRHPPKTVNHLEAEARSNIYWLRADYFHERELWQLAFENYKLALEWMPINGASWFGLGICCEHLASPRHAMYAYEQAIRFDPWSPDVRFNLAMLLIREQKFAEAERVLAEEIRINPNPDAKKLLDFARAKLGANVD